jgi:hypothetical protein
MDLICWVVHGYYQCGSIKDLIACEIMYLSACTTLDIYFLHIFGSTSNGAWSLFSVGCARERAGHRSEAVVAQGAAHKVCRFKYCTSSQYCLPDALQVSSLI